jgi:hypothetical protein
VPYFAVRGYNSISEMYQTGKQFGDIIDQGQDPIVLYLGDHDPIGMNMSDVAIEQLSMFADSDVEVRRVALNFDQVEEYTPPPNPAKVTDQRYSRYVREFGTECWELDALEPAIIDRLIRQEIEDMVDQEAWDNAKQHQAKNAKLLKQAALGWDTISRTLK